MICRVAANERLAHDIYAMLIEAPDAARDARPGQFLHVKCGGLTLRRPISIASAQNGQVKICYEVRGEGTAWLAGVKAGGELDIMGPIGKGWDAGGTGKALLAGGGIGIYPLYMLAQIYGARAHVALGFRDAGRINFEREFRETGCDLRVTTDAEALVTQVAEQILDGHEIDIVMTCGPKAMMRAVSADAARRGIRCQVSLEERMACGIGACLVCVCRVNGANERVCVDGPVFEGREIDWEW